MKLFANIHKIGTSASLLCAIHCMLMPLLIALLPLSGTFLLSSSFDKWMLLIGILLPLPDLCWGFRKHRSVQAFVLLFVGWGWWWIAHQMIFMWKHVACVALCAIAFLWSNLLNRRLCKECHHCSDSCDASLS